LGFVQKQLALGLVQRQLELTVQQRHSLAQQEVHLLLQAELARLIPRQEHFGQQVLGQPWTHAVPGPLAFSKQVAEPLPV